MSVVQLNMIATTHPATLSSALYMLLPVAVEKRGCSSVYRVLLNVHTFVMATKLNTLWYLVYFHWQGVIW